MTTTSFRSSIGGVAAFALAVLAGCAQPEMLVHRASRPLLGAVVEIVTEGPDNKRLVHATESAFGEMERLAAIMDEEDPRSAVSDLHREAGRNPVAVPPELMHLLRMARAVSERTQGAFDVTAGSLRDRRVGEKRPAQPAPVDYRDLVLDEAGRTAFLARPGMRLELGRVARLFLLHAGMVRLKRNAVAHAMISAGGDAEVVGKFGGRLWRVGIRDARAPDRLFGAVELKHGFVVSAGEHERYFIRSGGRYRDILDPRTGSPAAGPRGVTLIAEDLDLINGLAHAIMVMGEAKGRVLIEQQPALEGVIFNRDGSVWVSPGLGTRLGFERLDAAQPAAAARD